MKGRERLSRARRSVERGALDRALAEAWAATRHAFFERDEDVLGEVVELVSAIEERLAPRRRTEARRLVVYTRRCVDDVRAGWSPRAPLSRLFELRAGDRVKRCPDCAERVLEAARVCRYCGHRFGDPAQGKERR